MTEMQILSLTFVGSGLLMAILALPLTRRKVKPNPWYGFRVRATLEDPEVWYEVNAVAGQWLLRAGVLIIVVALVAYLIPGLSVDEYALICLMAMLGLLGVALVQGLRAITACANRKKDGSSR